MAGVIQIGDLIKLSEVAYSVWNYGWAEENNAGDNYRDFGNDVHTLVAGLQDLERSVEQAQTSLREHGARTDDKLGGNRASLTEIIGDYNKTLGDCKYLLDRNRRYNQTTGPIANIDWNINIMPQVEHLRGRIQMHNYRIEHAIRPFQIDLIKHIHDDLARRLTSMHEDVLVIRSNLNMLLVHCFPEVAEIIEQQSEQRFRSLTIPDSLLPRLELMFKCRQNGELDRPRTLQELTDCFLKHHRRSTVTFPRDPEYSGQCPPVVCYVELLKCQIIMDGIGNSSDFRSLTPRSHWHGYVKSLKEKLSEECSRFDTELTEPDTSECQDAMLTFWDEDKRNIQIPQQPIIPTLYEPLLEVPLSPEPAVAGWNKYMRLSRKSSSKREFQTVEVWRCNDPPEQEEYNEFNFRTDTASLIPIYADPADKEGMLAPLEIILQDKGASRRYAFLDIEDILLVQREITGFRVVANYMERPITTTFVKRRLSHSRPKENATVQLWVPWMGDKASSKRVGSLSQTSAASTLNSPSQASSTMSSQLAAAISPKNLSSPRPDVTSSPRAGITNFAMTPRRPSSPLLVLFTRDLKSSNYSIVAVKVDEKTIPNMKRCDCRRKDTECPYVVLEPPHGPLSAQRLENRVKWDLLPLVIAPSWDTLLRVTIKFPTAATRFKFSGKYCECKPRTEGEETKCLSMDHQGELGEVRVYHRRQLIMWEESGKRKR